MNELEFKNSEIPSPFVEPSPTDEFMLEFFQTILAFEPLAYFLTALLFLIFSVVLAIKTKASGRFLIAAGPFIIILFGMYQYISNPYYPVLNQGSALLQITLIKLVLVISVIVSTIGFCRFVWWAKKLTSQSSSQPTAAGTPQSGAPN